jgi:hypothetical protein
MLNASITDLTHAPPLVAGPLFAALFWWVMTAFGYRMLRVSRAPLADLDVWERGLLSAAIGAGTLQLLPLILSTVGHLRPLEIRIAFLLLAALLARDLLLISRRFFAEVSRLLPRHVTPIQVVWGSLFVVFMGIWLIHAVTFGNFGDDDGIHLAAPKRWLAAGTLQYLPTYSITNATLGFDMLYLVAMALWSPVGAKMLHYSAGIFTLLTLVLCARRISTPIAGLFAISLLLIATHVADVPVLFGNAMIDLAACWMTMTTVLLWLVWREKPHDGLLICMALCAGFAASFKLTCVQVAIAWTPILAAEARRRGATWLDAFKVVATFGVIAGMVVVPWFIRNALVTGNPFYPLLTGLIPTRDWSPEQGAVFSRYARYYSWGIVAGGRLDETARQLLLLAAGGLVCAGGATLAFVLRTWIARSLIAFAVVFILISIGLTGIIFRYWIPATMCLALLAGVVCAQRAPRRLLWPAALMLVIALGIQVRRGFYFHQPVGFWGDLRMATGLSTFDEEYAHDPLVKVWTYLNSSTPPDARVLFAAFYTTFGASSYAGFWVNRMCYTTDSHLQTYIRLDDWEAFKRSVAQAGITHVVISDEQFSAGRFGFSFQAGVNEFPFLRRLVKEYGQNVYRTDFMTVQRLDLESLSKSVGQVGAAPRSIALLLDRGTGAERSAEEGVSAR